MTKLTHMPRRHGLGACAGAHRPKLKSTAKQKKALSLKQQVALFYARKRRKARAAS